jgi:muconate cycloisomerase
VTAVTRIEVLTAELPFRFSFGHALAERRSSTNVFVRLSLDDGSVGWGEGVPRDYVTGETVEGTVEALTEHLSPALLGRAVGRFEDVPAAMEAALRAAAPAAEGTLRQAARCALELALLDACGRSMGRSVRDWLAPLSTGTVRYDAVIPFGSPRKLAAVALAIRLLRIRQVKIKVGADLERDLQALALLRRLLPRDTDLRVDANCAWTAGEALESLARMRPYRVSAVEQPVPGDDREGLRRVTADTHETIIADESLRTVEEAASLAEERACDAFNIRVSKCGGLLSSWRIARIAADSGLDCVVGAQVGESGILSAAARHLAACIGTPRYLEGSAGRLLLKEDVTVENVLPGWGGRAKTYDGAGLGVRVKEDMLRGRATVRGVFEAEALPSS